MQTAWVASGRPREGVARRPEDVGTLGGGLQQGGQPVLLHGAGSSPASAGAPGFAGENGSRLWTEVSILALLRAVGLCTPLSPQWGGDVPSPGEVAPAALLAVCGAQAPGTSVLVRSLVTSKCSCPLEAHENSGQQSAFSVCIIPASCGFPGSESGMVTG